MKNCLNCHQEVTENYCPNCGQAISTKKISNKSVFVDIPFSFFNMDNGFGYTFMQVLKRPIPAAKEFIEGKKIRFFRPLSFLLVITSISYLLTKLFSAPSEIATFEGLDGNQFGQKFGEFFMNYPQIIVLITIPFAAIGQRLSFLRKTGSFASHFYYVIFIQSFIALITFIPGIFLGQNSYYILISLIFNGIVIISSYIIIYKGIVKWYFSLFRCLLGVFYTMMLLFIIGVLAVFVVFGISSLFS